MKMKLLAKKANLDKARKLVKEAALKGAKIVVLPSMVNVSPFYLNYPPARAKNVARNQAERIPGSTTDYLSMTAVENGVFLIAGPIIERAGPRLFLSTVVIAPDGSITAKYRKMAINGLDEELGVSSGKTLYVLKNTSRKIGIMAEDDVYHPEIARSLLLMGSTLLIASLRIGDPVNRAKLLLMARAAENQVPVLAVGGALETNERYVEMPTFVVHPELGIRDEMKEEENYILVEVSDKPDNKRDIVEAMLKAKTLSQIYCKTAKESSSSLLLETTSYSEFEQREEYREYYKYL